MEKNLQGLANSYLADVVSHIEEFVTRAAQYNGIRLEIEVKNSGEIDVGSLDAQEKSTVMSFIQDMRYYSERCSFSIPLIDSVKDKELEEIKPFFEHMRKELFPDPEKVQKLALALEKLMKNKVLGDLVKKNQDIVEELAHNG